MKLKISIAALMVAAAVTSAQPPAVPGYKPPQVPGHTKPRKDADADRITKLEEKIIYLEELLEKALSNGAIKKPDVDSPPPEKRSAAPTYNPAAMSLLRELYEAKMITIPAARLK